MKITRQEVASKAFIEKMVMEDGGVAGRQRAGRES